MPASLPEINTLSNCSTVGHQRGKKYLYKTPEALPFSHFEVQTHHTPFLKMFLSQEVQTTQCGHLRKECIQTHLKSVGARKPFKQTFLSKFQKISLLEN